MLKNIILEPTLLLKVLHRTAELHCDRDVRSCGEQHSSSTQSVGRHS